MTSDGPNLGRAPAYRERACNDLLSGEFIGVVARTA